MRYGDGFGFLGFYIVRPGHRGRGHGLALWRAAMARLRPGTVGLDGVVAQQANYRRSGFDLLHRNICFGAARPVAPAAAAGVATRDAMDLPFEPLAAFDRRFFPAPRDAVLRAWIGAPGHVARVAVGPAGVFGLAVLRPCREGPKTGPLFADDGTAARPGLPGPAGTQCRCPRDGGRGGHDAGLRERAQVCRRAAIAAAFAHLRHHQLRAGMNAATPRRLTGPTGRV